jgi:hypothetical protein
MGIDESRSIEQTPLSAENIIKALPFTCKTSGGDFKTTQTLKNIKTSLKLMLENNLLHESSLNKELLVEFIETKERVREYIKGGKTWHRTWLTYLNDIKEAAKYALGINKHVTLSTSFAEVLTWFLHREYGAHLSKNKVCIEVAKDLFNKNSQKVCVNTVYNWMTAKRIPSGKASVQVVASLDEILRANGQLSGKIKTSFFNELPSLVPIRKASLMSFSPEFQKEINAYIKWRKEGLLPSTMGYLADFRPKNKDERRKVSTYKRVQGSKWQTSSAGITSSEAVFIRICRLFLDLVNEKFPGKTDRLESFRMSSMFNHEYMDIFVEYIKNRGCLCLGVMALTWLRSECGNNTFTSVYLKSDYPTEDDINAINEMEEWVDELLFLKIQIKLDMKALDDISEKLEGSRNVEWIINHDDPWHVINKTSKLMNYVAIQSLRPYHDHRAATLFDLLLICPLRIGNMCSLVYSGELSDAEERKLQTTEVCAVYKRIRNGQFVIYVHKNKLKNRNGAKVNSVIQPIYKKLNAKIESYLATRKAHLESFQWETNLFFPITVIANKEKAKEGARYDENGKLVDLATRPNTLSNHLSRRTKAIFDY